ncbi:DUF3667 domain-containing protein [Salinimicrobium soli]|uniref:DUF3667 domain-containing protein n=1 Tax=Salinimicrobium soli TaxID=1254399 RepID=UPI003AAE6F19
MSKENNLLPGPRIIKERHKLKYRSTECLNCHHPLDISDTYCPNCSQLNSTKKLAFNDFFNEFFAGIFAYDSRVYRTLGVLLFKPGKISKDYIEGKRVRYANPYRFYLSASILFFLAWSLTHDFDDTFEVPSETDIPREEQVKMTDSILAAEGIERPDVGVILPLTDTTKVKDIYISEEAIDTMGYWTGIGKKLNLFNKFYEETEIKSPDRALDSLKYTNTTSNHWLYKKTVDANRFTSEPGLFYDYFISKLPFIIFFYLPVFALFIWLLYIRRPFTYMEHLIFTFHNQTTWFVLYGISINLDSILETNAVTGITTLVFLFYLYKAFRRFYGQGRVKTLVKFIIINIIFFILAIIAAIFSVVASFAIY